MASVTSRFIAVLLMITAPAVRAADLKHDLLIIDEGLAHLLHVDENNPAKNWIVPTGHPQARDMQLVGGGRVLIGHDHGYSEFDIATGKVVKEVASYKGVTSARRLPNGDTLLAGVGLDGEKSVVILEVDAANAVKNKTVFPGNYIRLIRETPQGTWLMMNDTMVREGDRSGKLLHEWTVPGFRHAWKALRLPNGHTLASAGYGAFMVDLDANGAVAKKFAAKEDMPAAANANFYATFQLLPNGHIVLANWQQHGPGHGAEGVQLFELDENAKIVWQWSEAKIISSLQGVLVLDGLDTRVLHDERNGVMAPLPAAK
ncbi:MAG TPA: hypothetical protein VHD62_01770 [Opitutaceae bacterium]|nr:hypothetical protein [Opitutaceae bacterium]